MGNGFWNRKVFILETTFVTAIQRKPGYNQYAWRDGSPKSNGKRKMQNKLSLIMIPHEHGAWAMVAAPLLIGIGVAPAPNLAALLFALSALGFFFLRYPLAMAIKSRAPDARRHAERWSVIYGALTLLCGSALLASAPLWQFIPIGALGCASLALYLLLVARRAEMSVAGEWIGIAGLALGAPGAYLAATGALDGTALALYLLNVLFFGGTVFYIKFKVREQPRVVTAGASARERFWAGRGTIAYHAFALVVVALLALLGRVPALAAAALFLPLAKVVAGVASRPVRLNIARLGFIELGVTVAFAVIVLAAYR